MFFSLGPVECDRPAPGDRTMRFLGGMYALSAVLILRPLNETGMRRLARLAEGSRPSLFELGHIMPGLRYTQFDTVPDRLAGRVLESVSQVDDIRVAVAESMQVLPVGTPRLLYKLPDLAGELQKQINQAQSDPAPLAMYRIQTQTDDEYTVHLREDGSWWVSEDDDTQRVVSAGGPCADPLVGMMEWLRQLGSNWTVSAV